MIYFAVISGGFVDSFGTAAREIATFITESRYNEIKSKLGNHPTAPDGYTYKLRADTLEWELVELPPVEPELPTEEEALTRYANELTGADDPDLLSAAETLIADRIKEGAP